MSSTSPIARTSIVARHEEPVAVEVDGSVVMMSIDQGMYFGLEGTGPRIWSLLEQPRTVGEVCDALVREFDIDPEECEREVIDFLEELRDAQLIRVRDETGGPLHSRSGG